MCNKQFISLVADLLADFERLYSKPRLWENQAIAKIEGELRKKRITQKRKSHLLWLKDFLIASRDKPWPNA